LVSASGSVYDATGAMNDALAWSNVVLNNNSAEAARNAEALRHIGMSAEDAAKSIRIDLKGAMEDLAGATANWKETVASAAISAIESTEGLSEAQVTQLKAATDSMMGTTYLANEQMQKDLATAVADFKKTGDISEYEESLKTIADKFEFTLAPGIKKAQDSVDNLQNALNILKATPSMFK